MIRVTRQISIHKTEIHEQFARASGPGGQHVNKVSTAVKLRFDVAGSPSLPDRVRRRLLNLAGNQITRKGELVIEASRYRSRELNRKEALERLIRWIRKAAHEPRYRRKTRPPMASKKRRLEQKRRRGEIKRKRRPVPEF